MSRRFYIETSASGKQQFVKVKRSRSNGHHHHRHHHEHHDHDYDHHHHRWHDHIEYYTVSVEEWNLLKERERILDVNNQALIAENNTLRSSLSSAQSDVHRLEQVEIPALQAQINTLAADNDALRRSNDNAADLAARHHAEEEKLNCKIEKLQKQNRESQDEVSELRVKVRSLTRQLEDSCGRRIGDFPLIKELREEIQSWKCKFDDLHRDYKHILGILDTRTERMHAYEEILKRRHII
jgi:chromosome segregation ATPase